LFILLCENSLIKIPFNNQYACLGGKFYSEVLPIPVSQPSLIKFNDELAHSVGLSVDDFDRDDISAVFSGNVIPDGAQPLAMAYSGHQFGNFSPQLGDGRAILLGDIKDEDGTSVSVQLKGCGRTHFSRNGDGRAALGPVLREYLVSEAMAKLNTPTTRALAAVATGEGVNRECLVPGGIITRTASSFVRIGTFQYFAAQGDTASVKQLADFVIEQNYPDVTESGQPYADLLVAVIKGQASLIAKWMQLGFIHGVMNTDNMSIAGETIDYGPCAFIDAYAHNQVFSSIDRGGRYAYNNQPNIGLWNLTRLAESLLPLLADTTDKAVDIAQGILESFTEEYERFWLSGMRLKCGLQAIENSDRDDKVLIESLLDIMHSNSADFTLTFRSLSQLKVEPGQGDDGIRDLFQNPLQFDEWGEKWRERVIQQDLDDVERQKIMQAVNPIYIPRNHQIEAAIRAAEDNADYSVFHDLHEVLQSPFVRQVNKASYQLPPEPEEIIHQTFCGT